jgi:hypothetical protein
MTVEPDVKALEAAFIALFSWVMKGEACRPGKEWRRSGWEADVMPQSPAGPFNTIYNRNLGIYVYLRPEREGFGIMKRIDIRNGTPEAFLRAVEVTLGSVEVKEKGELTPTFDLRWLRSNDLEKPVLQQRFTMQDGHPIAFAISSQCGWVGSAAMAARASSPAVPLSGTMRG